MAQISVHRTVDAPAPVVWDVITDHELYGEVAPNLSTVEVLDGEGVGLIRRCVDTNGNEWTESCTRWEDGRGFAVSVDVEQSDFHRRLFSRFEGAWWLSEHEDGVQITMEFSFDPKYGPLGVLVSKFLEYRASPIVAELLDRWEAEIRSRVSDATAAERPDQDTLDGNPNALYR